MIAIPAPTIVPVAGGDSFPVRRVYCVGRNYRAHAIEMGADPDREAPFFFTKPADAVVSSGSAVAYPPRTSDYQHEIELVVAIGRRGRDIPVGRALEYVYGYAVGLDMTRRDLQIEARKAGRPWDMGKAFDESAPCGEISPAAMTGPLTGGGCVGSVAIDETSSPSPRQMSPRASTVRAQPICTASTGLCWIVVAVVIGDRPETPSAP